MDSSKSKEKAHARLLHGTTSHQRAYSLQCPACFLSTYSAFCTPMQAAPAPACFGLSPGATDCCQPSPADQPNCPGCCFLLTWRCLGHVTAQRFFCSLLRTGLICLLPHAVSSHVHATQLWSTAM